MLNDITLGQYFPAASPIHKMDPRAKILVTILFIIFSFLASNPISIGVMTLALIVLVVLTRVPIGIYLKNFKTLLPIVLFTAIINIFYIDKGAVLVDWWIIKITVGGIAQALFIALRILLLVIISAVLTYTTTPTALTDAIERLLSPLKFIGLGQTVHIMAMMMTIALRFIPTLIEETDKIMNAQKARGADMESGGLLKRIRAMLPILIPLLISSFRRAYELAEAMESRCYNGGAGRQRMKQLHLTGRDYLALALTVLLCAGVIFLNILFKSLAI